MSVVKKAFLLVLSTVILLVFCTGAFLMPKTVKATEILLPEIKNFSFEQLEPFGWEISASDIDGGSYHLSNQVFYDGEKSCRLEQNVYTIKNTDFINVDVNSEYVFGVKTYFSEIGNSCKLSIEVFNNNGEYLYSAEGKSAISNKQGAWQDISSVFQTQQNASKIKVKVEVDATSGYVCIDNVYGHKNFLKVLDGASINLETTDLALSRKGQLRFTAKIDKQAYDDFANAYNLDNPQKSIGFMLVPTTHLENVGEYTFKAFSDADNDKSILNLALNEWSNLYTIDEDGFYKFECILYGIEEEKIKVDVSVRAYIKYYENGQEKYLFSNYDEMVNSRSVYSVAVKAKEDEQMYSQYSQGQKEIINAFIEGREPNLENLD